MYDNIDDAMIYDLTMGKVSPSKKKTNGQYRSKLKERCTICNEEFDGRGFSAHFKTCKAQMEKELACERRSYHKRPAESQLPQTPKRGMSTCYADFNQEYAQPYPDR
jgi:hypothetical protein